MVLAIDISNYTDALSSSAFDGLQTAGVRHVIVQAIDPPPGYPRGRTRDQIQACLDAGLTVDAYIWLWFDLDVSDVQRKLALLDGLPVRQVWLDVEDTASVKYDQGTCERKVTEALAACDAYASTSGRPTGIYTGRWFWVDGRYLGNTSSFADRELWDANYDDIADAARGYVAYGGWPSVAIKQYRGTSVLAGIGGLDINVLSVAKEAEIYPPVEAEPTQPEDQPAPTPTDETVPAADDGQPRETPADFQWPTWRAAAINYKAIADELGKELADLRQTLGAPSA